MPRPPEVDRVDFLTGQLHALRCFSIALAELHRSPELQHEAEASFQYGLASMEMKPASDKAVAGFQDVADVIRRSLQGSTETP
jgi:hypothetical protein